MIKLARYLKPYLLPLFFAIALLFAQAFCDLNLPNYMSNIVSTGIQQGGIEHASPEAISAGGYRFLRVFFSPGDRELLDANYERIPAGGAENTDLLEQYPALAQEDIYVRKDMDSAALEALDQGFGKAAWTFLYYLQDSGQGQTASTDSSGLENLDLSLLYSMTPALEQLPESAFASAMEKSENTQDMMRQQTAISFVQKFYEELGMDTAGIQNAYILQCGLIMLAIALAGGVSTILVTMLASRISAGVSRDLRQDVFEKVSSFSNQEFDRFSTASLITRTTNDITQIQMLILMGIRMLCYAPIVGIGGTVMALGKSTSMAWVIGLAVLFMICLMGTIFAIAMPRFKKMQKLIDRLNLVARENLNGLMVIRAFGTEEFEKDRYNTANINLAKNQLVVNRVIVVLMPAMMLVMNLTNLFIVWLGSYQVANSALQIGDMMAFMQYAMQIILAFLMISMMFILIPRAAVSAARIREVLETESVIQDPEQPKPFDPAQTGVVEFKDVSFRYHGADEDILQHISFTAKPGQTTAFIGSTGSGKSTLINLIPRFYDVTSGEITVNGVNVKDVPQHELRDRIGYVPQKGVLHKGTIATNLRYGRPNATQEEVEEAAAVAQATDFIQKKAGRVRQPHFRRREQRLGRPEAAAFHCAGAGQEAGYLYL